MNIQYLEPFSRALTRMKKALFQPFDIRKWFILGFTAFLSGLTDCHGSSGGRAGGDKTARWEDVMEFPQRASDWLLDHPGWFALIVAGACILLVLALLAAWLSSRGKFMFLDNVVHNRAQIANPWREYRVEGNSLFVWTISIGFVLLAIIGLYVVECFSSLHELYLRLGSSPLLIGPAIWMVLGFLAIMIVAAYIELFLADFVVPIMYRNRIKTSQALSLFFRPLSSHPMHFVGYGLLVFLLMIFIVIGVVVVGLLTCCIGFLILAIPYINEVLLLPVTYTFRAFSVEFLEQFGTEYHLFPRGEVGTADHGTQPS